jgi:hypothetical protein
MSDEYLANKWGSYLPSLFNCLLETTGAVLEIGLGDISTPILSTFCKMGKRTHVKVESNPEWRDRFPETFGEDALPGFAALTDWSVVFIDSSPGELRANYALMFKDSADFIVVHDFDAFDVADPFIKILDLWRYRFVNDSFRPHTLTLGRIWIP